MQVFDEIPCENFMMFGENVAKVKKGTTDRISELPDFILHSILSILDTKEAGRASVLSKRWYRAWSSIPVLVFQPRYFNVDLHSETDDDNFQRFLEFVDETMQRYFTLEYRIRKMYLVVPMVDIKLETLIDSWINIAVRNQIEELEFQIEGDIDYMPPASLFCAKSLKVLKCENFDVPNYEMMELVSLTHLTLDQVIIDKYMLQRIISSCPLVELDITHGFLDKVSLPWTRKVEKGVEGCGSGIVESNLQIHPLQKFVFCSLCEDEPWPWNINVVALKNLRKLEFNCASITDDAVSELAYGLIALESLVLNSCLSLKCINISSISLKELQIIDGPDFIKAEFLDSENLMKVTVDAPNLLEFSYKCKLETSLSLIRVQDQCNAKFYPMMRNSLTTDWLVELRKFLDEKKVFKYLEMDMANCNQIVVEHDQLRNVGTSLQYKLSVLNLHRTSNWNPTESALVAFLDALFCCCHPHVLSITTSLPNSAAELLILSILKRKAECWKDPLKSIEVEGIEYPQLFSYSAELEIRLRLSW